VFLIGLTGGIASGKSTVAKMLHTLGAEVVDADQVAREVVEPGTSGLAQIQSEFGPEVLAPDGSLSRTKLAELVFSDQQKRLKLESILHPLIRARTMELFVKCQSRVLVYAVPLLVEAKVDYPFDMIVTVEAGAENQVKRMIESRQMSETEARARIEAQATETERVARADVVLDSSGSLEGLERQVHELWKEIAKRLAESESNGAH
jgi:dephospho-CoA kinase